MHIISNNRLEDAGDDTQPDYELTNPSRLYSYHTNDIPLTSAVQATRWFYGGRFDNQKVPSVFGEAPLVQNLDTEDEKGRSFDEILGAAMGAVRARKAGQVTKVTPDTISVLADDGEEVTHDLYNNFAFNQKSVAGATEIVVMRDQKLWRGAIRDYSWQAGDKTIAYDPETLCSAWQAITAKVAHANDKRLVRVTYASGREVVVTEDHSLLHFDGRSIAPIYPGHCVVGVTRSPLAFGMIADSAACSTANNDTWLGLLTGLYLAEGDLPLRRGGVTSGAIRIAVTGNHRRAQVDGVFERLGLRPNVKSPGRAVAHSRELCDWLEEHCGRGAGKKHIHTDLMTMSKAFRVGLLQGFMAGDGCMESDSNGALHVHAAVTSKRLRDDLVILLNGLGIFATVFFRARQCYSAKWADAYGFRVISSHLDKLPRWFFFDDRHNDFLGWRKDTYRTSPFARIAVPVSRATKRELAPLGLHKLRDARSASYVRRDSSGGLLVSKHIASGAEDGPYKLLGKSDLLWDTVVDIQEVEHEAEVYDLSVNNAEAFAVCGGLLVHNSGITSRALVKPGDRVDADGMLAASNYTDDNGVVATGVNARIGVAPYRGHSMDDAAPVSESFAARLSAMQYKVKQQELSDDLQVGLNHYRALFATKYPKDVLANFQDNGVVRKGTILQPGDPVILATLPRTMSSAGVNIGRLSRARQQTRRDASTVWDGNSPAEVIDARVTKNGVKVVLKYNAPAEVGDKIVLRAGAKATISKILPDDRMPQGEDGKPLDLLLNPLSLNSRANPSTLHELRLGKIAKLLGSPIKVPAYLPKGQSWVDYIDNLEQQHGVKSRELVYDPEGDRVLTEPITVGYGLVNRLHHTAHSKTGTRGVGSYDQQEQPSRGGGENAQAKRYSGLENYATLSSGAYAVMRENSTLRGQRHDDFWHRLRSGQSLPKTGVPFVWHKFRALLAGAGFNTKEHSGGRIRLAPYTNKDLDEQSPVDIENGDLVNLSNPQEASPISGGLFDPRIVAGEKWGRIKLPRPVINPAMEDSVRVLLGLTNQQLQDILAGKAELPEALVKRLLVKTEKPS